MLESAEAARRLGVKLTTLYAYVSRGLLVSHRSRTAGRPVRRGRRRASGSAGPERPGGRDPTGHRDDRGDPDPRHRSGLPGRPGGGPGRPGVVRDGRPAPVGLGPPGLRSAGDGRGPGLSRPGPPALGRGRTGARDAVRSDLRPEAVWRAGARIVASAVAVLGPHRPGPMAPRPEAGERPRRHSLAGRLTGHLVPSASADAVRAVDAALVLLADHELATSTVAVRVAASTRADPYDAVLAGLGTIGGPLHAGASRLVYDLLAEAAVRGPEPALDDAAALLGPGPGLRSRPVPERRSAGRPAGRLARAGPASPGRAGWLTAWSRRRPARGCPSPTSTWRWAPWGGCSVPGSDFGETVFTVSRMAGWIAHYVEELGEAPLRFRARAVYARTGGRSAGLTGRRPTGPGRTDTGRAERPPIPADWAATAPSDRRTRAGMAGRMTR